MYFSFVKINNTGQGLELICTATIDFDDAVNFFFSVTPVCVCV